MSPYKTKGCARLVLREPGRFLWRALIGFRANQGLLLAGAVAYYTLLSILPLFTLLLVVLSHVVSEQRLLSIVAEHLELMVPGQAGVLLDQIADFLAHREVIGWVGLGVLLFFSSLAFTILENAMCVIFYHRVAIRRRHFLTSAILPYLYILFLGVGLLLMAVISGALQRMEGHQVAIFGQVWSLTPLSGAALYLLGVTGQILMLTSIYLVMPVGQISARHALIGGVVAGILWEIARRLLVWYFSTLSLVNVVYGSLATSIVALLTLEAAAVILLFGAQVISEYERLAVGGKCPDSLAVVRTD